MVITPGLQKRPRENVRETIPEEQFHPALRRQSLHMDPFDLLSELWLRGPVVIASLNSFSI